MMELKLHYSHLFPVDKKQSIYGETRELSLKDGWLRTNMAFGPMEGAILVGLFLILFGPSQLPKLARSLGQAKSEFNKGLVEAVVEGTDAKTAVVDPLGFELDVGASLYGTLIRNLATNLAKCF